MGGLSGGGDVERRKYGEDGPFLDKEAYWAKHKEVKGDDFTEEDCEAEWGGSEVEPKAEPAPEAEAEAEE